MSTSLATIDRQAVGDKYDQREMIDVIKATVCKGASDAQLKMFIEVCRSTGLNAFLREIWYVADKGIIMAGRDGYLRVANENPNFDGMETRVERDEKNVPIKATCTVWRKDRGHPIIAEAYYSEYRKSSPVWSQYPSAMIGKVAEVLALKRSFSINGVVTEEEIGHDGAGSDAAAQAVAQEKIRALKGEPVERTYEPVEEDVPVPVTTLHEDIVDAEQVEKKSTSRAYDKYKMFAALDEVKARFILIDKEQEYRKILSHFGAAKRTELPTNDGGKAARSCYKELTLRIADLEVAAVQAGKLPNPFLPDLQDYPSEVQPFCRVKGELFKYVDDEAGSGYRPWPAKKK